MNAITNQQKVIIKRLALAFLLLLAIFGGWQAYQASKFHIVRTDPKLSGVSKVSPYLRVYFNDELDAKSLKTSFSDDFVTNTKVDGKVITFTFLENLSGNITYTITLDSLKNTLGEEITNKRLSFMAKDIAYNDLSGQQQQELVGRQDEQIYTVNNINYEQFNELLDYGLSTGHVENIKMAIFDYSNIVGEEYRTITLNPTTIKVNRHNPSGASTINSATFAIILDRESFVVTAEYDLMYDSVYTQMRNKAGELVYDSAAGEDL